MTRKNEGILDLLRHLPWWVSMCVGAAVFLTVRYGVPALVRGNPLFEQLGRLAPQLAWVALIFLLPAAFSALEARRKRRLLESQDGIDSIRQLSWKQFEELLAEAYRHKGYAVEENTSLGPDGGVDLRLRKSGALYLVQCKQWLTRQVGVKVVREMLGIMSHECAAGAIIVTSGCFTQDAKAFAQGKPIELVEADQLTALIRSAQGRPAAMASTPVRPTPKQCPRCGRELALREAKRGPYAGSIFWGCSGYPGCRYTAAYENQ